MLFSFKLLQNNNLKLLIINALKNLLKASHFDLLIVVTKMAQNELKDE